MCDVLFHDNIAILQLDMSWHGIQYFINSKFLLEWSIEFANEQQICDLDMPNIYILWTIHNSNYNMTLEIKVNSYNYKLQSQSIIWYKQIPNHWQIFI